MPRLMSVSLTETQVRARTKTVTRRAGWLMLRPGDRLTLCRKVMGRRKGEPLERITDVEVISVRREPLNRITAAHVAAEGLPGLDSGPVVEFFCGSHRAAPRTPTSPVSSGATWIRRAPVPDGGTRHTEAVTRPTATEPRLPLVPPSLPTGRPAPLAWTGCPAPVSLISGQPGDGH